MPLVLHDDSAGEVTVGNDSEQFPFAHDGKVADTFFGDDAHGFADGEAGFDDHQLPGHDFTNFSVFGINAFGDDFHEDVSFGEHTDEFFTLHDEKCANAFMFHVFCGLSDAGFWSDLVNVAVFFFEYVCEG